MIKKIFNTDADRRRSVASLPVGTVMLWHKDSPPGGWHLLDGTELAIADHTSLYNLITVNGTVFPYGANTNGSGGAGSTHFRLPDLTDLFVVGANSSGNVGTNVGSDTHTHTFSIASALNTSSANSSHSHNYSPGNLANTGVNHTHYVDVSFSPNESNAGTNVRRAATGNTGAAFQLHGHNAAANTNAAGDHAHSIVGGNGFTTENAHSHAISVSFGSYTPTAVSHIPLHQRVYFVVFSGA